MRPYGGGAVRSRMQYRMPAIIPPPMMDEDMEFPGGGDMGMEMSDPYEQNLPMNPLEGNNPLMDLARPSGARAFPVHSMEEAKQFYKGLERPMGQPMETMTRAYEGAPQGPIKSKLHAAQHQMMVGDQKAALQLKRAELTSKRQQLNDVIMGIRRGEIMDTDGRLLRGAAAGIGQIDKLLGQIPMEYRTTE